MAKGVKGSTPTEDLPKRTSVIIRPSTWEKVKFIGFMDKKELSSIVEEALLTVINEWESRNGKIKVR